MSPQEFLNKLRSLTLPAGPTWGEYAGKTLDEVVNSTYFKDNPTVKNQSKINKIVIELEYEVPYDVQKGDTITPGTPPTETYTDEVKYYEDCKSKKVIFIRQQPKTFYDFQ
jgi:hypothetical protein